MLTLPEARPRFADVVLDLPLAEERAYTYRVPQAMDEVQTGYGVLVPFGPRKNVPGLVVALHDREPAVVTRELSAVLGGDLVPRPLAGLFGWVAETYLCHPAAVWRAAVPAGVLSRKPPRTERVVVRLPGKPALSGRQREVMDVLDGRGGRLAMAELLREAHTTAALVQGLVDRGGVAIETRRVWRSPLTSALPPGPVPELTGDQRSALEAIGEALSSEPPGIALLHGVTGSGKTEVYLRAIGETLGKGRGAIVLVPEIALTPQTVARFVSRFGERVAVLHSALSGGERLDAWHRLRMGDARVAVGARSAVFAPVQDLGLIVVDEEHEGSYKQENVPRYAARAVAIERARREAAGVILGSATPSIESYELAREGRYALVRMPRRVGDRPLPPVEVVDMRVELLDGNKSLFSRALADGLSGLKADGHQAILLLNRRGYSRCVLCRDCGAAVRCPRCAVTLTMHRAATDHLRCHYCDFAMPVPVNCPACKSPKIRHFGAGTQQVADALQQRFPDLRVLRLDRDTTSRKGAHDAILSSFGRGEADVLIGTQMVAKGLDFPRVVLVGVLAADLALNVPDFRAAERTFQLLTQVAGRAGRGDAGGRVVVQAYAPEHYSIRAAQQHDFEAFHVQEVGDRRLLGYPPFGRLVSLIASAEDPAAALRYAEALADALVMALFGTEAQVLGPAEAAIARLRGFHRFQLLLKLPSGMEAAGPIRSALARIGRPKGVRLAVDVDPMNLM